MCIENYIALKQVNGKGEQTLKHYRQELNHIQKHIGKPIDDITKNEFVMYLSRYKTQATRNNKIIALKNYYKELEMDKKLKELKKIKPLAIKPDHKKGKEKLITEETLRKMIQVQHHPRDKAILEFLYITGFRLSEMVSCNYGDVVFENGKLYIGCNDSKTDTREIPIFKKSIYLQDWINIFHRTKNPDDPLFYNDKNKQVVKRLSGTRIWEIVKEASGKADVREYTNHDFRHTFATHLARRNISRKYINQYMGWSENSNMIIWYDHTDLKDVESIFFEDIETPKTNREVQEEVNEYQQKILEQEQQMNEMKKEMENLKKLFKASQT